MSNEKRRDSKGRVLQTGEGQLGGGRYYFRYTAPDGTRQEVYSWRLVATDPIPAGVRACEALRDKEKAIRRDLEDGIRSVDAEKMTVNEVFDKWLAEQQGGRDPGTVAGYKALYNTHFREQLGHKKIKNLRHSDVVRRYTAMVVEDGLSVSTVASLNSAVGQAFQMAVQDGLIRVNPAVGATKGLSALVKGETKVKDALTATQQSRLLAFVASSLRFRRMLPLLVVLFGTGMRIAEALGLVVSECDFGTGMIHVVRQLRYRKDDDSPAHYILKDYLKTTAGRRDIPMLSEVGQALHSQIALNASMGYPPFEINGVSGFIFFSPHTCRHSFATRLYENGVDPKTVQAVLGHKRYETSINTYTHTDNQKNMTEFKQIHGRMSLACTD